METDFIEDDSKFKRLHRFLNEENITKHMNLLNKAKA
jgi:hypothetical protein